MQQRSRSAGAALSAWGLRHRLLCSGPMQRMRSGTVLSAWRLRHRLLCSDQGRRQTEVLCGRVVEAMEEPSDPEAMYREGMAFFSGESGAPKDTAAAKGLLRRAASMGHSRAQATIGRIVYDEMEALRALAQAHDYQAAAEAHKWLTRASEQGERDATRTLIPLYITKGDLAAAIRMTVLWMRPVSYTHLTLPTICSV